MTAISNKKLDAMVKSAKDHEAWHETDDIDPGKAFSYALKAADHVQQLAKEVRLLKQAARRRKLVPR